MVSVMIESLVLALVGGVIGGGAGLSGLQRFSHVDHELAELQPGGLRFRGDAGIARARHRLGRVHRVDRRHFPRHPRRAPAHRGGLAGIMRSKDFLGWMKRAIYTCRIFIQGDNSHYDNDRRGHLRARQACSAEAVVSARIIDVRVTIESCDRNQLVEAVRRIPAENLGQRRRMTSSMNCSRNDVVLLLIPFTDLTSRKVCRPSSSAAAAQNFSRPDFIRPGQHGCSARRVARGGITALGRQSPAYHRGRKARRQNCRPTGRRRCSMVETSGCERG